MVDEDSHSPDLSVLQVKKVIQQFCWLIIIYYHYHHHFLVLIEDKVVYQRWLRRKIA